MSCYYCSFCFLWRMSKRLDSMISYATYWYFRLYIYSDWNYCCAYFSSCFYLPSLTGPSCQCLSCYSCCSECRHLQHSKHEYFLHLWSLAAIVHSSIHLNQKQILLHALFCEIPHIAHLMSDLVISSKFCQIFHYASSYLNIFLWFN